MKNETEFAREQKRAHGDQTKTYKKAINETVNLLKRNEHEIESLTQHILDTKSKHKSDKKILVELNKDME